MKVLLFICVLAIFLFFYSFQEGYVNSPQHIVLLGLKEEFHENKRLGEIISEYEERINSNKLSIDMDEDLLTSEIDGTRKNAEDNITKNKTENAKFQVVIDTLNKLIASKGINSATTLGEAIRKEEASPPKTTPSIPSTPSTSSCRAGARSMMSSRSSNN